MKLKTLYLNFIIVLIAVPGSAQIGSEELIIPKTNSKAVIQQTIASTQINIYYNRPNRRGRKIFGDLVPFGQVWRTGSDETTKIAFNTPISVEGNLLDSGEYELFTIPGKDKWEVILQKNQRQWGSYKYNPENDALKFYVSPIEMSKTVETFTISIDNIGSNYGVLNISWENVIIPIKITINLKSTVIPSLEKALVENDRPPYFQAAMFYFENNIDINRAAELMSLALERNPKHIGMLYRYALILKEKGDIQGAINASELSLKEAQHAGTELKTEYMRLNSTLLNELKSQKR